jgi:hypothetical protein|tara:strand:+ start:1219 stop:1512 length:294 start_codon:yes stop_codon:yes gene_type:complete
MGKLINIKEYQKPKVIQGYRMSFYNEKEIDLALLCLNVYGFSYKKYDRANLKQLDPLYIKECMIRAYNSELISALAKKVLMQIIDNMEEIAIPATRH